MYRKDYQASHNLPVPKITVKQPITRGKYRKNANKHGSIQKQANRNHTNKNGGQRGEGLPIWMLGKALRSSHPKML